MITETLCVNEGEPALLTSRVVRLSPACRLNHQRRSLG